MVIVNLQHPQEVLELKNRKDKGKAKAVGNLKHLLKLEKAKWIGIKIKGRGTINGSNLKTQQKIKEIYNIVKKLIN